MRVGRTQGQKISKEMIPKGGKKTHTCVVKEKGERRLEDI